MFYTVLELWRYSYGVIVEVLLYVHRNRRLIRDGEPRTATSTFTHLLSSASELTQAPVFIRFGEFAGLDLQPIKNDLVVWPC